MAAMNDGPRMNDVLKQVADSPWVKFALIAFTIGVAWSDLHAQIRENKMEADARFAVMASDIHVLKVLACKSYPKDSECAVP